MLRKKLCACGCGKPTRCAPHSSAARGWVRGKPLRFLAGHNTRKPLGRLLRNYVRTPSGCFLWQGSTANGYGTLTHNYRRLLAHRAVWEKARGPIPAGLQVCHECDTPLCVRLSHLFLGTNQDNVADRCAKGRTARGEKSGPAKLRDRDVVRIKKALRASAPCSELAKRYRVSRAAVYAIKRGFNWGHLKEAAT